MNEQQLLRIGKISSINYKNGTARVTYEDKDGETTAEFSFLIIGHEYYWNPTVGDQVLVAHISNGTCAGVILGEVWHNGHRPTEGFEGLFRREFSEELGQATERYDANGEEYSREISGTVSESATKQWSIQVGGASIQFNEDGRITISAAKDIIIDTPMVFKYSSGEKHHTVVEGDFTTQNGYDYLQTVQHQVPNPGVEPETEG